MKASAPLQEILLSFEQFSFCGLRALKYLISKGLASNILTFLLNSARISLIISVWISMCGQVLFDALWLTIVLSLLIDESSAIEAERK